MLIILGSEALQTPIAAEPTPGNSSKTNGVCMMMISCRCIFLVIVKTLCVVGARSRRGGLLRSLH
jgi:hypothetical protein